MNRSKIEWCDHTWNPITGCRHGCPYCYARRMTTRFAGDVRRNLMAKMDYSTVPAKDGTGDVYMLDSAMVNETGNTLVYPFGFEPTYHRYRLDYPGKLKMGKNIFVGAMSDAFGSWVPDEWIREILSVCEKYDEHNFLFLTKNPERYVQIQVPIADNLWYGTTITCEEDADRFNYLPAAGKKFVSIEPLLGDISAENNVMFRQVEWVIIGAETGSLKKRVKVVPDFEWIKSIVRAADSNGVPVFMKDSLIPIVGEENMRRDFPRGLQRTVLSEKMKNKLYDVCSKCGGKNKKADMASITAKKGKYGPSRQFAFLCEECLKKQCAEWGVEVPVLEKMEDEKNGRISN